jgi:hypothetical protein
MRITKKISDFIAIKYFYWQEQLPWFLWKLSYVLLGIEVLSIALYILAAID